MLVRPIGNRRVHFHGVKTVHGTQKEVPEIVYSAESDMRSGTDRARNQISSDARNQNRNMSERRVVRSSPK